MEADLIYPIALMASAKPILLREEPEDLVLIKHLLTGSPDDTFSIVFSSFRDNKNLYHMSYMIENLGDKDIAPYFLSKNFKDLSSQKVKDFINYPTKHFKSFERAILVFEDKGYDINEFHKIVSDWKKGLINSGLEI